MTQPRTALIALAATGALLLSGCGAGAPGAAVRVDGESIPMSTVDQVVETMCSAKVAPLWLQGKKLPNASQRSQVAIGLAFAALADRFASEHDLDQPALDKALGSARAEIRGLVGDVDEATETNLLAQQKLFAVRDQAGRESLEADGTAESEITDEAATTRGAEVLTEWLAGQDVEFDPRLGVELTGGQVQFTESQASYPVSEIARAAGEEQPTEKYLAELPENQRCG